MPYVNQTDWDQLKDICKPDRLGSIKGNMRIKPDRPGSIKGEKPDRLEEKGKSYNVVVGQRKLRCVLHRIPRKGISVTV